MSPGGRQPWSVSGPAGFFRVFDVAFFLPGVLLAAAVWLWFRDVAGAKVGDLLPLQTEPVWTVRSAFTGAMVLAMVFLAGLLAHAVHRMVYDGFKYLANGRPKALSGRHGKGSKPELQLYFWNLASLSWNLEAAVLLGATLLAWRGRAFPVIAWGFMTAAAFPILWVLSRRAEDRATISVLRGVLVLIGVIVVAWAGSAEASGRRLLLYGMTVLALVLLGFNGWDMRCAYWRNGAGEAASANEEQAGC